MKAIARLGAGCFVLLIGTPAHHAYAQDEPAAAPAAPAPHTCPVAPPCPADLAPALERCNETVATLTAGKSAVEAASKALSTELQKAKEASETQAATLKEAQDALRRANNNLYRKEAEVAQARKAETALREAAEKLRPTDPQAAKVVFDTADQYKQTGDKGALELTQLQATQTEKKLAATEAASKSASDEKAAVTAAANTVKSISDRKVTADEITALLTLLTGAALAVFVLLVGVPVIASMSRPKLRGYFELTELKGDTDAQKEMHARDLFERLRSHQQLAVNDWLIHQRLARWLAQLLKFGIVIAAIFFVSVVAYVWHRFSGGHLTESAIADIKTSTVVTLAGSVVAPLGFLLAAYNSIHGKSLAAMKFCKELNLIEGITHQTAGGAQPRPDGEDDEEDPDEADDLKSFLPKEEDPDDDKATRGTPDQTTSSKSPEAGASTKPQGESSPAPRAVELCVDEDGTTQG